MIRRKPLKRKTPLRKVALKKPSRIKTPKASTLKAKLWKIFSEYIRRKDADHQGLAACVSCGKIDHWKNLDAGHYIPKSLGLSIYFEERNVAPQCAGCNRFRHGHLTSYALYLIKTYGAGILDDLDALRRTKAKFSASDYLELIEAYKQKLDALQTKEAA